MQNTMCKDPFLHADIGDLQALGREIAFSTSADRAGLAKNNLCQQTFRSVQPKHPILNNV